jgi:hypothetical protein
MKKALIEFSLILFLPILTFGQLNKGSWLGSFSGGFAYDHNTYESPAGDNYKTNSFSFYLNSRMGIFVANRLAIGPGLAFSIEYDKNTDEYADVSFKSHSTIYSIAFNPFFRYYFATQGKLAFFAQASGTIGYGQNFFTNEGTGDQSNKTTLNILTYGGGAGIGIVYFLTNNIGMETLLAYNYTEKSIKTDDKNPESDNSLIGIELGLSFYFNKPKKQE